MKILLISLLLLSFHALKAQHSTLRFTDEPIDLNRQSLLIVPFESKMYITDVNKQLAEANNLTSSEILSRFTSAIDQSIIYSFEQKCNVSSFYLLDDSESKTDLAYVYQNRRLEYELVSETVEKTKTEKLKDKLKKKEETKYQGGSIIDGQIVSKRDDRERYMKAVIRDQNMLDSMVTKFDNNYFLFVNELDIRNNYSDAVDMQKNGYNREIKLHYTLYHKNGEILSTGISRTTFPSSQNDINVIIKSYFPILAQQIQEDLFPPLEEKKTGKKIGLKKWM